MREVEATIEARVAAYRAMPHDHFSSFAIPSPTASDLVAIVASYVALTGWKLGTFALLVAGHDGLAAAVAVAPIGGLALYAGLSRPRPSFQDFRRLNAVVVAHGGVADLERHFPPPAPGRRRCIAWARVARRFEYPIRRRFVLHPELGPVAVADARRRLRLSGAPLSQIVPTTAAEALALEELRGEGDRGPASPYRG